MVVGIFIVISGDVKGHMAFLQPLSALCSFLTGIEQPRLMSWAASALQELGNIVTSLPHALSTMTNLLMVPSVPGLAIDGWSGGERFGRGAGDGRGNVIRTRFSADANIERTHPFPA